jgi:transcriptional regulator with XRE-family HTH domain
MTVNPSLAHLIRLHRKAAGLSRVELALFAGVGKTLIYDLEHGKDSIRFDTLQKVLQILNISVIFDSPLLRATNE